MWTKKLRVKVNETKSSYINFTNKRIDKVLISICSKVPRYQTPLELTCQEKVEELNIIFQKMNWLLRRHYTGAQQMVRYSRTNGVYDQYGHMESSYGDAQRITPKKYKALHSVVNVPKYVHVTNLHKDLGVKTVTDIKEHVDPHKRCPDSRCQDLHSAASKTPSRLSCQHHQKTKKIQGEILTYYNILI